MRLFDADELVEALDAINEAAKEQTDIMASLRKQLLVGFAKQILSVAPTVKAIPIEWIDTYCTDSDIGLRDNDPVAVKKLLEDWKKENDRD